MTSGRDERSVQDRVAAHYEHTRYALPWARRYHEWWVRQMLALADPVARTGRILDDGCGVGFLLERLDARSAAVGLDLSLSMLIPAKRAGRCVLGDSERLPFDDRSFDLAFARSLLHHLSNPFAGVRELHRVLRPGQQAIVADTNASLLSALPRRFAYRSERFSDQHRNFKRREYLAMLAEAFAIERVVHFGFLAYPLAFPDMLGPARRIPVPAGLMTALIAIDRAIARTPLVKRQSWGLIVSLRKTA